MEETSVLSRHVATCEYGSIPAPVLERSRTLVRDLLGVALYGSQHATGRRIAAYVDATAPGERSTVFGRGTASPTGAALANGVFAHLLDYDDTFESVVLHPSAAVFPAALAVAEHVDATGGELLTGYVVGLDVALGLGRATFPSHYDYGWHATGTLGSFGAAAAAASVLDLDVERTEHALGMVASSSSSLLKNAASMTKSLHAGHAAQMGVRAALLAAEGFTADREVLEGDRGYGSLMTPDGSYDPAAVTADLGETWAVMDVGIKPYACGRITHAGLEALRTILRREELTAEDVARVTVTLDAAAAKILDYEEPTNQFEAKASIEFPHAAVLREGRAGVHEFTDEYVREPRTRTQMAKIERAFEENLFERGYGSYGARLVVETTDGRTVEATETDAIGSPANPLSETRLRRKFEECAGAVLSPEEVATLDAAVEDLGTDRTFQTLCRTLRAPSTVDSTV